MRHLLFISVLILCFYSFNSPHSNSIIALIYPNIENVDWRIESIVTKQGTENPDEIVQNNKAAIIYSGNILKGIINLKNHKTISIKENDPQFYLNYYEQYRWELLDNNFIQFKRFDNNGRAMQSFGFNVRFISENKMQWFSVSTGIESGIKSVRIITFYHK